MRDQDLLAAAAAARENSYSPYSGFRVGAALLGKSGRVYTGCNVENAAYGPTNCAERTAIYTAIAAGERDFTAIAVTSDGEEYTSPCGTCRQVMVEFNPQLRVIMGNVHGGYQVRTAAELLPLYFSLSRQEEKDEV